MNTVTDTSYNPNHPVTLLLLGLMWAVGTIYHFTERTAHFIKVMAPVWARRTAVQLAADYRIAKLVYSGQNVIMVCELESAPPEEVNKYHLRYAGTDREEK